jgi:mono/diheme cytochrome c family protein
MPVFPDRPMTAATTRDRHNASLLTGSRRVVRRWLSVTIALALCTVAAAAQQRRPDAATPRQDYNSAEYVYRVFCASCHGPGGKGDGAVAGILRVPPPDLTTITARGGGSFPADQIYRAIDGREIVAAHGRREMPIWGDVLKITEGQSEAVIRKRITALVAYLESLQTKPPEPQDAAVR